MRGEVSHPAHDLPCDECPETFCDGVRMMTTAADVTDEVIEYVVDLVDSDFGDSPIDWETVWDRRLDGARLGDDNRPIDLGDQYDTPAMRKIQRQVRKIRAQG